MHESSEEDEAVKVVGLVVLKRVEPDTVDILSEDPEESEHAAGADAECENRISCKPGS